MIKPRELEQKLLDAARMVAPDSVAGTPFDLALAMNDETLAVVDQVLDPFRRTEQPVIAERIKVRFGMFNIVRSQDIPSGEAWITGPDYGNITHVTGIE